MAEDYDTKLLELKGQIERAHENLLDIYLGRIREKYKTLPSDRQEDFLGGLENLVQDLENGIPFAGRKPKISPFNPQEAKKIREEAGLTQAQLVIKLKLEGHYTPTISRYESGMASPSNHPKEKTRKYLLWLKEHGYNPFNL